MTTDTALVQVVRGVGRDPRLQDWIEGLSDDDLAVLGLTPDEVAAIRDGVLDRVLRLGLMVDPDAAAFGCCA